MDSLVFRCPGCQQPFQVLAEQAGQMVRCPSCEDTVQIPAAQTKNNAAKSEAVPPSPSSPNRKENDSKSKAEPNKASQQKSEEVQAYGCPKCEKPFGIYPSMMGSEMACPHCQQTVLLQPKTKPSATGNSSLAVKSKLKPDSKSKPNPKAKPKQNPKSHAKTTANVNAPVKDRPSPEKAEQKPNPGPSIASEKHSEPPKSSQPSVSSLGKRGGKPETSDESLSPLIPDPGERVASGSLDQKTEVEQTDEPVEAPVVAFVAQPVDHLLPPKFGAVDPAFFYRRHQDGSQVLLPSEDGGLKVVNNRIVKIEHKGQVYELISSPEYDRMQRAIVNNLLAVVICGLLIAIVMTLLNW